MIAGKETWEGTTDTENPRRLCADLNIRQVSTGVDADFWDRNIIDIAYNYDEIFLNSGTLVFYAIAAAARANGVKVLLSGVGGDELFGGYPWQVGMRRLPRACLQSGMRRISTRWSKTLHSLLAQRGPGRYLSARAARAYRLFGQFQVWHAQSLCSAFVPYLGDVDRGVTERIESCSEDYFRVALQAVHGDPYNEVHYANIFTVIGNQNHQFDMASMRHSVENRSPLLDFNVVEYLMSVPDQLKNRSGPKSLMRDIVSSFLPAYVTQAKKSGPTMPQHRWFAEEGLGRLTRRYVIANRHLVAELMSAELATRMNEDSFFDGATGAMRLFALVSFILWAKINVEQAPLDRQARFTELAAASIH
jgi:asparagine synthase (glutamine-hydrolysing)